MKIYLASSYGRREQLKSVRDELLRMGHAVTGSWLDTSFELNCGGSSAACATEWEAVCVTDLQDLLAASCCISFTEEPDSANGKRGGRHVEFGVALQAGKRLIVVGPRENVFHHHPKVEVFESQWDMLRAVASA